VGKSPSTGAQLSAGEAHRYSGSVESVVTTEAISSGIWPSSLYRGDNQPQTEVNKTSLKAPTRGASDDSNLPMLSRDAAIYQTDTNLPSTLQNARDDYSHNGLTKYERAMVSKPIEPHFIKNGLFAKDRLGSRPMETSFG
jgi:hypothetical protein